MVARPEIGVDYWDQVRSFEDILVFLESTFLCSQRPLQPSKETTCNSKDIRTCIENILIFEVEKHRLCGFLNE